MAAVLCKSDQCTVNKTDAIQIWEQSAVYSYQYKQMSEVNKHIYLSYVGKDRSSRGESWWRQGLNILSADVGTSSGHGPGRTRSGR